MPEINPTAAYVRTRSGSAADIPEADRVLKLLATLQTVDSLSRSMADGSGQAVARNDIIATMNELFSRDLIELSPDA